MLEALGQAPTEDELFTMISEVDENMSGSIDFGEVSLRALPCLMCSISLIHYVSLSKLSKLKRSELRI